MCPPHPDSTPSQPARTVYLGEEYVNSRTLADVTFMVEGRPFYAHRIALLASSDAFRAMFNGGYREKEAASIEIPNIEYGVFEVMMRYIYTGQVRQCGYALLPEVTICCLQCVLWSTWFAVPRHASHGLALVCALLPYRLKSQLRLLGVHISPTCLCQAVVPRDKARELLQAADQYLLEGLKRLCEVAISQVGEHNEGPVS